MGAQKCPLSKICHTHPTMMKLGTVILYLKKIHKNINHVTHPLSSAEIEKYNYRLQFNTLFLILLNFFWIFKGCFDKHGCSFDDTSKIDVLDLLKTKIFWRKCSDVIIFIHYVTKRILSREANYIVDVVMWPKFGNSNMSMREANITSIS